MNQQLTSFIKTLLFILCFSFSAKTFSYEVDNYTNRDQLEKLEDGLPLLNQETNLRLEKSIDSLNKIRDYKCSKDTQQVYLYVKNALDNDPVGKLESWAEETAKFPKIKVGGTDIYSGSSFASGVVRSLMGLESSTKVANVVMGVDKFGHFMAQGFDYFSQKQSGKKLSEILDYGEYLENGYYGLSTTGVKSYGDLGANFSGMQFWMELLEGDNPYLKCNPATEKMEIRRKINWADYINPSWDEAINCSEFSESVAINVEKNSLKLKIQCPVKIDSCKKIANLNCAERFVSKKCLDLVPDRKKYCSLDEMKKKSVVLSVEKNCDKLASVQIMDARQEKMLLTLQKSLESQFL